MGPSVLSLPTVDPNAKGGVPIIAVSPCGPCILFCAEGIHSTLSSSGGISLMCRYRFSVGGEKVSSASLDHFRPISSTCLLMILLVPVADWIKLTKFRNTS